MGLTLFAGFGPGGCEPAVCTVVAAFIVGFTEHYGTLLGQYLFGYWIADYRGLISMFFIYFGLLLLPRGLPELLASVKRASSFIRRNQEGVIKVAAVVLVIVSFSALVWNVQMSTISDEKAGWINVSNKVGGAGGMIYSDSEDPNLPESLSFRVAYPTTISEVNRLYEFTAIIQARDISIVYLHNGALYLFIDPGQGYVYDPHSDNFGR